MITILLLPTLPSASPKRYLVFLSCLVYSRRPSLLPRGSLHGKPERQPVWHRSRQNPARRRSTLYQTFLDRWDMAGWRVLGPKAQECISFWDPLQRVRQRKQPWSPLSKHS